MLLDAAAVGGSVSADRRKKPSSVVHSRTVTVRVLAVTSVILTLSINDRTPGGGSHTSAGRVECTGDQCAGLQRFTSGDPTCDDDVVSPAPVFPRTLPGSFLPANGLFLCSVLRSRFGARRALMSLFLILSRRTDGDEDDVWRAERVVLECSRTPYVAAASSTDRDAVAAAQPLTFRRELWSSSSSLVSSDDTDSAVGDTDASSVSLDSLDGGSG